MYACVSVCVYVLMWRIACYRAFELKMIATSENADALPPIYLEFKWFREESGKCMSLVAIGRAQFENSFIACET